MNRLSRHEVTLPVVVQLLLLLLSPNVTSQIVVPQGEITTMSVVNLPGITYSWEIYFGTNANFAAVSGNCPATFATFSGSRTGSTVRILWLQPGTFFFKVTARDEAGCTMNLKIGKVRVNPVEAYRNIAFPDYVRISWSQDTVINVLANDWSPIEINPGSVHVVLPPVRGKTIVNTDGSITYIPVNKQPGRDQFVYGVCNVIDDCDSATVTIDIYDSRIAFSKGFSPNGDGLNDRLVIEGLDKYPGSQLYVYSRLGQLVYQSSDYRNDWDGSFAKSKIASLQTAPVGIYYYVLKLGGTNRTIKGFIYIGY